MYSLDQNNSNHNSGFYHQPLGAKPDFNAYVVPTSSTSTGSNNSSMHSSQSMPDIMLEERQHHLHTSPKKSVNLPFHNYHTQTPPPPLIYPSSSTTTAVQFATLSSSVSTPTTCTSNNTSRNDKSLDFPALFSLNHSSADETGSKFARNALKFEIYLPFLFLLVVQSLLNNMSIGQSNNLSH